MKNDNSFVTVLDYMIYYSFMQFCRLSFVYTCSLIRFNLDFLCIQNLLINLNFFHRHDTIFTECYQLHELNILVRGTYW